MSVTTKFPNLVDAIITALGNASSLSGVRIFDGAQVDESYPADAVAIGHDGSFGDTEIQAGTITNSPLDFVDQHQEEGVIACSLWSMDGTTDITARRTRAFALLSAVDTVIRLDPTFGGIVFYTILESNSVVYRQTSMGVAVVLDFSIRYMAQS